MGRTIAFSNIKGGSGKTTTTVNIAAALAHKGYKVLLLDTDPQGHASLSLGITPNNIRRDLFALLTEDIEPKSVMYNGFLPNLKIIPATKRLVSFEKNYSRDKSARSRLAQKIVQEKKEFDYTILDTPPTISLLTFAALIASEEVIIPVQAHYLGMRGVFEMVRLLYKINQVYHTDLNLTGIIPTFYSEKMRLSKAVVTEIKRTLGEGIFLHPVRNNIALAEAPMFGKSIFQYNGKSIGAADYLKIADQIVQMNVSRESDNETETPSLDGPDLEIP